jgi:hypothetical protein
MKTGAEDEVKLALAAAWLTCRAARLIPFTSNFWGTLGFFQKNFQEPQRPV